MKNNTLWEGCVTRLDSKTFANPDKDPTAKARCFERAESLRKQGLSVTPVVIEEILRREV